MPTDTKLLASKRKLALINRRIDGHVLNSTPMKEAREVVAQHQGEDREEVNLILSERGLPSIGKQGKALFLGLTSLARLNRKRIKLERCIARLETREVP